jgi:hypothetical protein
MAAIAFGESFPEPSETLHAHTRDNKSVVNV